MKIIFVLLLSILNLCASSMDASVPVDEGLHNEVAGLILVYWAGIGDLYGNGCHNPDFGCEKDISRAQANQYNMPMQNKLRDNVHCFKQSLNQLIGTNQPGLSDLVTTVYCQLDWLHKVRSHNDSTQNSNRKTALTNLKKLYDELDQRRF
ncbi:MAG: hypothetical protein NTX76_03130 [Alphaproteobacteria bacterium]|nr:hypothetical protein [Alphaproteobacteria bacterium]